MNTNAKNLQTFEFDNYLVQYDSNNQVGKVIYTKNSVMREESFVLTAGGSAVYDTGLLTWVPYWLQRWIGHNLP